MKTKLFLIVFAAILYSTNVIPQKNNSGVYLSAEDFSAKKISFEGYKIKTNLLFNPTEIKVVGDGNTTKLAKVNIFGYHTDNKTFRYYNGLTYEVLNPQDGFLIYELKRLSFSKNQQMPLYFFSVTADAPIQNLTLMNVKKAFPDDRSFHYEMDMLFRYDGDLLRYDTYYHKYQIVELVKEVNPVAKM